MTLEKAVRIARFSVTPNKPYHVQWLLTRKCNYRCQGCNVWQEQDSKELSTNEIKKGLRILKKLGVIDIVFSGGAPLLRDDIDEILEYASRYFITTIYDNGSLALEKIEALEHADFVAISLDTLNPAKNDQLKGIKGSWDKALHAIETLHKKGVSVSVSPTISQFNLHEIADLTRYFVGKDIPVWYCLYTFDTQVDLGQLFKIGKRKSEFEIVDRDAMMELCNTLIEMKKQNANILITTKTLEAVRHLFSDGKRIWKCRALRNFFMIDHLGSVAGCHLRKPVATIFELARKWNGQEFNSLRQNYSQCERCTYLCYIVYSLHGTVLGNLQIAQDRWKTAKLLLKRKNPMLLSSVIQK